MKVLLKTLLIFIYFCLCFFVKPGEVFAVNNVLDNTYFNNYISKSETKIILSDTIEEFYIVAQNYNQIQICNSSNKNNNSNAGFDNQVLSDTFLNGCLFIKNNNSHNRMAHNISPNLKNAIYTRAP